MTLYRANDRLPQDERILIIRDMDEFKLWQERSYLNIHGIICKHPLDQSLIQEAATHLAELSKNKAGPFSDSYYMDDYERQNNPLGRDTHFDIATQDILKKELGDSGMNERSKEIITKLTNVFHDTVTLEAQRKNEFLPMSMISLRVNDASVNNGYHQHNTTLSFFFSGKGTQCHSGFGNDEIGEEYSADAGSILLFDDTIWHKSPDFEENWKNDPRVGLVI